MALHLTPPSAPPPHYYFLAHMSDVACIRTNKWHCVWLYVVTAVKHKIWPELLRTWNMSALTDPCDSIVHEIATASFARMKTAKIKLKQLNDNKTKTDIFKERKKWNRLYEKNNNGWIKIVNYWTIKALVDPRWRVMDHMMYHTRWVLTRGGTRGETLPVIH